MESSLAISYVIGTEDPDFSNSPRSIVHKTNPSVVGAPLATPSVKGLVRNRGAPLTMAGDASNAALAPMPVSTPRRDGIKSRFMRGPALLESRRYDGCVSADFRQARLPLRQPKRRAPPMVQRISGDAKRTARKQGASSWVTHISWRRHARPAASVAAS